MVRRQGKELDLRQGLPEGHSEPCCYSCEFLCSSTGRKHTCKADETEKIITPTLHSCKRYKYTKLKQCEICQRFYRSLGGHVKSHGISAAQYKEIYGFNRHSSLCSPATQRLLGESVSEERREDLRIRMTELGKDPGKRVIKTGYKLRAEARIKQAKRIRSAVHGQRISMSLKGRPSPLKGTSFTEEHKNRISKSLTSYLRQSPRKIERDHLGRIKTYTKKEL